MARPQCPRRISHVPPSDYFKPAGIPLSELEEIALAADEMEALRLADSEGLYHTEAAAEMSVSRQTFDRILRSAHVKVARALCEGMALRIQRENPPSPGKVHDENCAHDHGDGAEGRCGHLMHGHSHGRRHGHDHGGLASDA
jgi:predicted DNA-binding protein (UPF0251 family)